MKVAVLVAPERGAWVQSRPLDWNAALESFKKQTHEQAPHVLALSSVGQKDAVDGYHAQLLGFWNQSQRALAMRSAL